MVTPVYISTTYPPTPNYVAPFLPRADGEKTSQKKKGGDRHNTTTNKTHVNDPRPPRHDVVQAHE